MIGFLTGPAARVDGWLHQRLGRTYGVMLSIGLVADIGHRIFDAPKHVQERHHLAGMILAVAMELALLLHQLAEMHERLGRRSPDTGDRPPTEAAER
ncbi:MAG: hypothetical protein WA840_07640 [Caulobacteraceae bacterium]